MHPLLGSFRPATSGRHDTPEGQERDSAPRQVAGAGTDLVSHTHSTVAVHQVSDRTSAQEANAPLSRSELCANHSANG